MKTIMLKITSFLFMLSLIITAGCSKQKRIENHLTKVKNWNIAKIEYQKAQSGSSMVAKVGTETNAGTMVFEKDGSGSYDYILDGQHRSGNFTWTNTVNDVTFNYVAASTTVVQVASYTILNQSSKTMNLQGAEVIVDSNGQLTLNATFYLVK